eukprot:scaffold95720_cov31-Prasinocladus_malaysianus.AAC.1
MQFLRPSTPSYHTPEIVGLCWCDTDELKVETQRELMGLTTTWADVEPAARAYDTVPDARTSRAIDH